MKKTFTVFSLAMVVVCSHSGEKWITLPDGSQRKGIVPASSVGIGTPPVAMNICTKTNNYCVTSATLPVVIAPLIQNQGGAKAWTAYFLGETKCSGASWNVCTTIQPDGSLVATLPFRAMTSHFGPPMQYTDISSSFNVGDVCHTASVPFVASPVISNTSRTNGLPPDSWTITSTNPSFLYNSVCSGL